MIMISLGDSYSSGESIEKFYGQDASIANKVSDPDWLAHRSTHSWAGMLKLPSVKGKMADNRNEKWYFAAASGAVTDNLLEPFAKVYRQGRLFGRYELEPQLNIFNKVEKGDVDYVTLTLGGNDVGFSSIIRKCLFVGTYFNKSGLADKLDRTWKDFYEDGGAKDKLYDAYNNIASKAGRQANIIVVGYPQLLEKNGAGWGFNEDESNRVNKSVSRFNKEIQMLVNLCKDEGLNIYFVSVEDAFEGHEAYSNTPYIRSIIFSAQDEDINDAKLSAYSVHPNYFGACAYAACVQNKIDEIEASKIDEIEMDQTEDNPVTNLLKTITNKVKTLTEGHIRAVFNPEEVVLKLYDAYASGDVNRAIECYKPSIEREAKLWADLAYSVLEFLDESELSFWNEALAEIAKLTNFQVVECYSYNLGFDNNTNGLSRLVTKIPGVKTVISNTANVYIKYQFTIEGESYIVEEVYSVKRYLGYGWRIDTKLSEEITEIN